MPRVAKFSPLQSLDAATLLGVYVPIGGPIPDAAVIFKFVNTSNVEVLISTDGVTDEDVLPAGTFTLYDIQANREIEAQFAFRAQTQFFIKGAPGIGSVYLTVIQAEI